MGTLRLHKHSNKALTTPDYRFLRALPTSGASYETPANSETLGHFKNPYQALDIEKSFQGFDIL